MRKFPQRSDGFSLVELMVALAFTGILMAGMSLVFKSSLTTFYTSAEGLSAYRRNRASMDMLYEDINSIGLYLSDLTGTPSGLGPNNPPFFFKPHQPVQNGGAGDFADELYFYIDQPYPFVGTLAKLPGGSYMTLSNGGVINANQNVAVAKGGDPSYALSTYDSTIQVDCGNPVYAQQVYNDYLKYGLNPNLILQDNYSPFVTTGQKPPSGSILNFTTGQSANIAMTGEGNSGAYQPMSHRLNTNVTLYLPGQWIRYSVQALKLDPQNAGYAVPCLVRDQGTYDGTTFTAIAGLQQVINENVTGFQIFLSAAPGYLQANDPTHAWAPFTTYTTPPTDFATYWSGKDGVLGNLDTQLTSVGRTGATTSSDASWFRSIPVVVRVDLTTRTATKRSEYSTSAATPTDYKYVKRTFAMVPRHFGLPFN